MASSYPTELLQKTAQSPRSLFDDSEGCSLIVLACHCFLVHDGFKVLGTGTSCWNRYLPPSTWSANNTYWCLKYSHRALKNGFLLEAHRQGKQLLIRVIEDNPKAAPAEGLTVKMLGLNSDKYVPDPEALWQAHKGWHRAISAEACSRLAALWEEAIREPLLATVERNPSYPPSADIFQPPMAEEVTTWELMIWGAIGSCVLLSLVGVVWAVSGASDPSTASRTGSKAK